MSSENGQLSLPQFMVVEEPRQEGLGTFILCTQKPKLLARAYELAPTAKGLESLEALKAHFNVGGNFVTTKQLVFVGAVEMYDKLKGTEGHESLINETMQAMAKWYTDLLEWEDEQVE
ncbi:hypothetical protein [Persicobacter psychrovividus]|uniref:Uncharacterized protein n=1 Tax=Persicobacter psychrovividus TaxID=387638 RepID=A0ABM7VJN3_9BACT|nr:hypothetical protein PEPS_33100 [Persicobacter psychrovividus]